MKLYLLSLCLFCLAFHTDLKAQDYSFKSQGFQDKKIELTAEEKALDELVIFQHRKIEVAVDGNDVKQFFLLHQQVLVNSDRAIENNNKIYISFSRNSEIVKNINRVILPSGKSIELKDKDIHEEVDPESGSKYQYYAVRGLEKGAIIEKLYILEQAPDLKGGTYNFQQSRQVKESLFQVVTPKHLILKHKSYNGLPEATLIEDRLDDRNVLEVIAKDVMPLNSDEKLSNLAAERMKFRYKLFENTLSNKKNFYNYNDFAKDFYSNYEEELSKKEKSALIKFFKPVLISADEKKNILSIENHIKKSITYNAQFGDNQSLSDIFKNRQGRLFDLITIYRYAFQYFGIKSEFVLTSNRFDSPFDKDFETTNNLQDVLIYLPNSDQYLDAKNQNYRSPLITFGLGNTHGIKIKEVAFGGSTMATSEPTYIKLPNPKITTDTMSIVVDFTKDIENPYVESQIIFGGYSGASFQGIKDYVPANRYEEILDDISKNYAADVEIESIKPKHDGLDFMGKRNFELNIKLYSEDLIQNAGGKYLYEVGRLIGKQGQLYQEKKRTMPIEMRYAHYYERKIVLKLPEGYKIANPEVFNFDFSLESEGEKSALFTSKYEINGNEITVTNNEYYAKVNFSLSEFEDFREVYNAAADFNKLTVIIEKK